MIERSSTQYHPRTVSPPGETLVEVLEDRQLAPEQLAERMGVPTGIVEDIVRGHGVIDAEIAQRFEQVLGTSASFWLRRESRYRENLACIARSRMLDVDASWLREIPVLSMFDLGWIRSNYGKGRTVLECLGFFAVDSVDSWRARWGHVGAAFRTSGHAKALPGAVAAWLRKGEIDAAELECGEYDKAKLMSAMGALRAQTLVHRPEEFVPTIQRMCADCGVAAVFVPTPKGCPASGAARWVNDRAVVQLSLRYKTNDHLWFTFFHELGHIVLHERRFMFFEAEFASVLQLEDEANRFAQDILVPPEHAMRLPDVAGSASDVQAFARELGVAPGIIVGRLQHDGLLRWEQMRELKTSYDWDSFV